MGFQQAILSCYRDNYVGFTGRAPRSEYWFFVLGNVLAFMVILAVTYPLGGIYLAGPGAGLFVLASFLPSLAAQVRRLHDTNASGWWLLLAFIPYAGGLIMLVWFCLPGTKGENRFGSDPLDPSNVAAFE